MATKVKGEAIKEGSIPFSALTTEVKDKIENAGADWNAQEGENGYVENRTHYSYVFNKSAVYDENSNFSNISFYIDISNVTISKDAFFGTALIVNVSTSLGETVIGINKEQYMEMEAGNRVLITANFPNESIDLYVSYHEYLDLTKKEAIISIDGAVYGTYTLSCILVKQLDSGYLPDTVIKTTPQTLSTADKNQALSNLGIDPVVWKYMCDPCEIYISDSYDDNINNVPEDIIPIIFSDGIINKNLLNLCVFHLYIGTNEYLAKPTYIEDNQSIYVNVPGISLNYEQSDNAIYMGS